MRLLEYSSENVPPGGIQVYAQLCSLTKSYGKEAAGHIFHDKALLQSGLVRGTSSLAISLPGISLGIFHLLPGLNRNDCLVHACR